MNELVVTKSINFNGKDIPIITGDLVIIIEL